MSVNTDELINELTNVLKNGLNKLLADYNEKYTLYEETHKCVANLHGLLNKSSNLVDDIRYDKLENQIQQMNLEIAQMKSTFEKVEQNSNPKVATATIVTIKEEPMVKAAPTTSVATASEVTVSTFEKGGAKSDFGATASEATVSEVTIIETPSVEKENIILVIEHVPNDDPKNDHSEGADEKDSEGEESECEVDEKEKESEGVESEGVESEGEELSDEEEEDDKVEDEKPVTSDDAKPADKPADDEEELFEIEIDDVSYCTNDENNGIIYALTADGDVGDKVGYLKDGEPFFD